MANKRDFKKYVDSVGASVCEAMMTTYYNVKDVDKEAVEKAMGMTLAAVENARAHSNIFFDKGSKAFESGKEYSKEKKDFFDKLFDKINADFSKEIDAAIKVFNAAIPQQAKEENKKAVAQ